MVAHTQKDISIYLEIYVYTMKVTRRARAQGLVVFALSILFALFVCPPLAKAQTTPDHKENVIVAGCNFTECTYLSAVLATYGDKNLQVKLRGRRKGKSNRSESRVLFVGSHPCPIVWSLRQRRIFGYGVEAFHGLRKKGVDEVEDSYCRRVRPGILSSASPSRSRSRSRGNLHSNQLKVSVAGVQQRLPFGNGHFSIGYAAFVLEHLALQTITKALLEWRRVVQRGLVVAISVFEGEYDLTVKSKVAAAKGLPPPIMKSQEWWEGIFKDAQFDMDHELNAKFQKKLLKQVDRLPGDGDDGNRLNQTQTQIHINTSGKVFFLKKRRNEFDSPTDFDVQEIVASTSEFDARGTYGGKRKEAEGKGKGKLKEGKKKGEGEMRSEFDVREVHRSRAVEKVEAHRSNRGKVKRMSQARRKEKERENLHPGQTRDSVFSHEYWSKLSSNSDHSHEAFHKESQEAKHLKKDQVAGAREDLQRLRAEEKNLENYLKLGQKELEEKRKALPKRRSSHKRGGRRGRRSNRKNKKGWKEYENRKSLVNQAKQESDSVATELFHREAEIANSDSDAVSNYRERHAQHLSRAEFIRQEQARLMSRSKRRVNPRHHLPVGVKKGVKKQKPE